MKVLIIGHGRHGKDTVAELLQEMHGLRFRSSSRFCAEQIVFPWLSDRYRTAEECFADRHNAREMWRDIIANYNAPSPARLAKEILQESDVYVGMRAFTEFTAAKPLFDKILYVSAWPRVTYRDATFNIAYNPTCMRYISNVRGLDYLKRQLYAL